MHWALLFYQTASGRRPVVACIEGLADPARAEADALLAALRDRGNLLRMPHSRALGDGLFELRGMKHSVRIYYTFLPGRRIVLLDGDVKKRDDIPSASLRRLRALRQEVLAWDPREDPQ